MDFELSRSGARTLALAVILQAMNDAEWAVKTCRTRKFSGARRRGLDPANMNGVWGGATNEELAAFSSAIWSWAVENHDAKHGFVWWCQQADLDEDATRRELRQRLRGFSRPRFFGESRLEDQSL